MALIFLRRRRLGAGSLAGMVQVLRDMDPFYNGAGPEDVRIVRSWIPEEVGAITREDFVVRWGCTATINTRDPFNSARSIHWCANKRESRLHMQREGVPVPETWAAEAFHADILSGTVPEGQFVLRPLTHSQGRMLWTGDAPTIHEEMRRNRLTDAGYISRLIPKVAEYRVFCIKNRVAWVARKTPGNPDQVAWNVAQGGRFDNVRWADWPKRVVQAALAAAAVSGTDFCGVDVMIDAEGLPYVLEVNSAPSQTSVYRQRCTALAIWYHYRTGNTDSFPDIRDSPRRTYKSYIHPALQLNREES